MIFTLGFSMPSPPKLQKNATCPNFDRFSSRYARTGAEAAFSELVRRHVQLVYGTALRLVRNPQFAEDLTQEVFLLLARKAPTLVRHPTICGWLHLTARNLATKSIRSEARRRIREEEVADMEESRNEDALISWEELAPRVDELLGKLSEPDREALLLRFFQNKSAREMAEMLSLSAEAAQKRVTRALARLRACGRVLVARR
jgi:RNA polymerase sigma factor (sigma-70 family)